MLKEKFEVREHVVTERLLIEQRRVCDVCGKEIDRQYYWAGSIGRVEYGEYVGEYFDACSEECLKEKCNQYCELSKQNNNYEMDVERAWFMRKA